MNFKQRFESLDKLLTNCRHWWQFAPFHHVSSRWQTIAEELHLELEKYHWAYPQLSHPELVKERQALQPNDVRKKNKSVEGLNLAAFIPELTKIRQLTQWDRANHCLEAPDSHWQYQIAGRKWSQITRFVPHIPKNKKLVEWCSGKGHLGRLAATQGAKSILSLEWKQSLCEKNRELNQRLEIEQRYCQTAVEQCDVMSEHVSDHLNENQFPIALHACGDLHTQLVKQVVEHGMTGICLAPCCFNLIAGEKYQPLSQQAKLSRLSLSKFDLSLPLKKLVTAGKREKQEQTKEKLWRIAFDCWQRQLLNKENYLPLPTIPKSILKSDFKKFIQWASQQKNYQQLIDNSSNVDASSILNVGLKRLPAIHQMEWVQHHFQRAIEVWLVLDQALYLEENGYQCEIIEFCDQAFSPRNLMLKANLVSR